MTTRKTLVHSSTDMKLVMPCDLSKDVKLVGFPISESVSCFNNQVFHLIDEADKSALAEIRLTVLPSSVEVWLRRGIGVCSKPRSFALLKEYEGTTYTVGGILTDVMEFMLFADNDYYFGGNHENRFSRLVRSALTDFDDVTDFYLTVQRIINYAQLYPITMRAPLTYLGRAHYLVSKANSFWVSQLIREYTTTGICVETVIAVHDSIEFKEVGRELDYTQSNSEERVVWN